MRIVMIAHSTAHWTPHFSRFFLSRGHDVLVISFAPHEVHGVKEVKMLFVGVEPFDFYKNKHLFITRVPRIRRAIREFRPDIVFAPYLSSNGLSAALAWKGPLVVCSVGGDTLNHAARKGLGQWLRTTTIKYVSRHADVINTVSRQLSDALRQLGVPEAKIVEMPFGVDMEQFYPAPDMPRSQGGRLICTRKHEPIYDIPTVIDAAARLKQGGRRFELTLTCGGTLLEAHKVRASAAGLDDCTSFTGNLPFGELPRLLREADIYISASHGDGTSVALLEAMASGLFPVVSDIEANRPWVEHGVNGLLFKTGSSDSLAENLVRAISDDNLRRSAFARNRERVDREANMKTNMERMEEIFEEILRRRGRWPSGKQS